MFGKGSRKLETIIGDGTRVVGQVSVKGTIRIDGIVEGDLHADWVVVGEAGKIVGNASMTGEIRAPKLAVSEGAVFDGRSRMKGETEPSEAQDGKVRTLIPAKGATGAN